MGAVSTHEPPHCFAEFLEWLHARHGDDSWPSPEQDRPRPQSNMRSATTPSVLFFSATPCPLSRIASGLGGPHFSCTVLCGLPSTSPSAPHALHSSHLLPHPPRLSCLHFSLFPLSWFPASMRSLLLRFLSPSSAQECPAQLPALSGLCLSPVLACCFCAPFELRPAFTDRAKIITFIINTQICQIGLSACVDGVLATLLQTWPRPTNNPPRLQYFEEAQSCRLCNCGRCRRFRRRHHARLLFGRGLRVQKRTVGGSSGTMCW